MRIGARSVRVREGLPVERLELSAKELALVERLRRNKASIDELMRDSELSGGEVRRLLYLLTLVRGIETAEGKATVSGLTVDTIPPAPKPDSIPSEATPRPSIAAPRPSIAAPNPSGVTVGPFVAAPRSTGVAPRPSMPAPRPPSKPSESAGHFASPPTTTTAALPAPPVPAGLNPADSARWHELGTLYDKLDQITHYQLLPVSPSASPQDINTAYFGLVKSFHPDRLPASLAPLQRCAQLLFERLTEANDALGKPELRVRVRPSGRRRRRHARFGAHDAQRARLGARVPKSRGADEAPRLQRRPCSCCAARSPRTPTSGDYHALYAWLLHLMNPTDPAPIDEMLSSLDRALKSNPQSERAHYYKGVVLKRLKRDREALSHFHAAVQINPRNVDAAREVRLATMRRESKPPPPGLLSKLLQGSRKTRP